MAVSSIGNQGLNEGTDPAVFIVGGGGGGRWYKFYITNTIT